MLLAAIFLFVLQVVLTLLFVSRRIDALSDRADAATGRLDAISARQDITNKRLSGIAEGTQLVVNDIRRRAKRRARAEAAATSAEASEVPPC